MGFQLAQKLMILSDIKRPKRVRIYYHVHRGRLVIVVLTCMLYNVSPYMNTQMT